MRCFYDAGDVLDVFSVSKPEEPDSASLEESRAGAVATRAIESDLRRRRGRRSSLRAGATGGQASATLSSRRPSLLGSAAG